MKLFSVDVPLKVKALYVLIEHMFRDDKIEVMKLAKCSGLNMSTVKKMMNQLKDKGLLTKEVKHYRQAKRCIWRIKHE